MTYSFEAKLHGFRRTQDGVVISYVCHPSDVSAEMAIAALGTRYMVAVSEIGDDEQPKEELARTGVDYVQNPIEETAKSNADMAKPQKRKFSDMPLSQQAALRCNELSFQLFLEETCPHMPRVGWSAADEVRERCKVQSRAEFNTVPLAADAWNSLEGSYQLWLTDKNFAGTKHG